MSRLSGAKRLPIGARVESDMPRACSGIEDFGEATAQCLVRPPTSWQRQAHLSDVPETFDKKPGDPGVTIAQAILQNPQMSSEDSEGLRFAIFNAKSRDDGIVEGDFARVGSVNWPHVEQDQETNKEVLTNAVLEAMPYCHFFFDPQSQIAAFQSAQMNRSLAKMLVGWISY